MTYNPAIPLVGDALSTSQPQMQNNFNQLNVQFGVDHSAFNTGVGNGTGFHKKVTWPDQTSSIPTSSANQIVAYGLTTNSITMPYYKRDGLATTFALAPIKGYVSFSITSDTTGTILDSFNITLTSVATAISVTTVTFGITRAMSSATNYGALLTPNKQVDFDFYTVINASSFSVSIRKGSSTYPLRFTAALLEF